MKKTGVKKFTQNKAIVFGGSGFLGSFVADELSLRGFKVSIFDEKISPYLRINQKMIIGNILDSQAVSSAVKDHDIVYNFAGVSDLNHSINNPVPTLELNIMGNTHILEACVEHKVKRFLYASTVYVFSDKGSFYGVSKRCAEKIIEEYSLEKNLAHTIIRYGSVYGPRSNHQNRLYRLIQQALNTGEIVFQGSGQEEREYIHVKDAARLSVDLLAEEFVGENVMLTGVERLSYSNLLKMIQEIFQNKVKIKYLNEEYKGHYLLTPYAFAPKAGKKLLANPFVDFGQGLVSLIEEIVQEEREENIFLQ